MGADEALYRMTEGVRHTPNLPFAPFGHRDLNDGLV
jgi:hypothetical protein